MILFRWPTADQGHMYFGQDRGLVACQSRLRRGQPGGGLVGNAELAMRDLEWPRRLL